MNWVGGARNRIRTTEDKKKQKEFFQKRKLANSCSRLKQKGQSTIPYLSQDLLFLQALDKCAKKPKPSTPSTVTKVDLDVLAKHRRIKAFDLELPITPEHTADKVGGEKHSSKVFCGYVSSELAQKPENKCSIKISDEGATPAKHSTHDKETAMKNWEKKWLKPNCSPAHHAEKSKPHDRGEGFPRPDKESCFKSAFTPAVLGNKVPDSSKFATLPSCLPNESRMYKTNPHSQVPNEERNHQDILSGLGSNCVGRHEQLNSSKRDSYPEFDVCEALIGAYAKPGNCTSSESGYRPCAKEMLQKSDTTGHVMDECIIADMLKCKHSENDFQKYSNLASKEKFHNLQNSYFLDGFKEDGNVPFMKPWDRSGHRNAFFEVKAVREKGVHEKHSDKLHAKKRTMSQDNSAISTSKNSTSAQESSKGGPEKQVVVVDLEEDENDIAEDSTALHTPKNPDGHSCKSVKEHVPKPTIDPVEMPENILNENDQLKQMIPLLIKEFVSQFREKHAILKNDLKRDQRALLTINTENSSQDVAKHSFPASSTTFSAQKGRHPDHFHWGVPKLDVYNGESQNLHEDEDPMGSFLEYSCLLSEPSSQNSHLPTEISSSKNNSGGLNGDFRNFGTENVNVTKTTRGLFSNKTLNQSEENKRSEFPPECHDFENFSNQTENEICIQAIKPKVYKEINKCVPPEAKMGTYLSDTVENTDVATQTLVSVEHSACQAVKCVMDASVQTCIDRSICTLIDRSSQTPIDTCVKTCDRSIQTHIEKTAPMPADIVCDIPKFVPKKEAD